MPIRILSVDDHEVVRKGIAALIATEQELELVAEAGTGREAIDLFRRKAPDVTLMDLRLPDMSGIDATREIRSKSPDGQDHRLDFLRR